jgi:hypothetical protein
MFGLLKPKPKKREVELPPQIDRDDFADQYNALANKLGITQRATPLLSSRALAVALKDLQITCYDRADVEKYMDRKGRWNWFPIRADDKYSGNSSAINYRVTQHRFARIYGGYDSTLYTSPIPYPVLLTIEQITEKVPYARFYVAALNDKPDPFLAVVLNDEVYVIERWDEPSFRGR